MGTDDIRWLQRFANFKRAFAKLEEAVMRVKNDFGIDASGSIDDDAFMDDIIKEGVIQRFEYTHELAWNVMKDFLSQVGNVQIYGSKDATKEAFAAGLIFDGEVWMDMIASRNKTSHTYNETTADAIFMKVIQTYYPCFSAFDAEMDAQRKRAGL